MQLRFLVGGAGTGKTHRCLSELCEALIAAPLGGPSLIFIVPEQATFQMERALLRHDPRLTAVAGNPVVSFSRLARSILDETGYGALKPTTGHGQTLALLTVVAQNRHRLKLLGSSSTAPGFLDRLTETLRELKAYRIDEDVLDNVREQVDPDSLLGMKLHDMAVLVRAYHNFMQAKAHEIKLPLELATASLPKAASLKGARVWIDGFSGFTPQEYAFLAGLTSVVDEMTVAMCIDVNALESPDPMSWREGPEDELFHPVKETAIRLRDLATNLGGFIATPTLLKPPVAPRFQDQPVLMDVARLTADDLSPIPPGGPSRRSTSSGEGGSDAGREPGHAVEVIYAPDVVGEVEAVAAQVSRLVRDDHMRYNDIAVIVRDLAPYREAFETIFPAWDIPYFLDVKHTADHHPAVALLKNALQLARGRWSSQRVVAYLKNDLLPVERHVVDAFENHMIVSGVTRLNLYRDDLPADLKPALHAVRDLYEQTSATPGKEEADSVEEDETVQRPALHYVTALRAFLEASQGASRMEQWIDNPDTDAREQTGVHRQVWDGVLSLLDEAEDVLGDTLMGFDAFCELFEAGLGQLRIGQVPPTVDQLLVGTIERSRQPDLKVAIIMGCNDGVFPQVPEEDAIFLDEERQSLAQIGVTLGPTSRVNLLHESYFVYIALTRASQRLIMTCARSDRSGRPMRPSSFLTRLTASLPGVAIQTIDSHEDGAALPKRAGALAGWLADKLRRGIDGDGTIRNDIHRLRVVWHAIDADARRSPFAALTYKNVADRLSPPLAHRLLGEPIMLSPSRLESAAACRFQHFGRYTLGLSLREPPTLDPMTLGELRHAALKVFVERVVREGIDWASMEEGQSDARMREALALVILPPLRERIEQRPTDRYVMERLARGLTAFGRAMLEHARRGAFRPAALERFFGGEAGMPPVELQLRDGRRAYVRGRIDRVDVGGPDDNYILIIDYKSSTRRFRLDEVAYGIDMQLTFYMLAVKDQIDHLLGAPGQVGDDAVVAGALYAPVFEPIVRVDVPPPDDGKQWLRELKFEGIVLDDDVVPRLLDREAASYSTIVPLRFVKSGGVSQSQSSTAQKAQMDALLRAALHVAEDVASGIAAGNTDINPYYWQQQTPCRFCELKPVCQFDTALPTNRYRFLPSNRNQWAFIEELAEAGSPRGGGRTDGTTMD